MELIYIILLIFTFYFIYKNMETLQNTKEIIIDVPCEHCNIWNHLDAKTKCNNACQKKDYVKLYNFTGKWRANDNKLQNSICQCKKIGELNKNYIGCPLGTSCFIWNHSDAKNKCPQICQKYLPNINTDWTGNWKSTSVDSSSCECQYYY